MNSARKSAKYGGAEDGLKKNYGALDDCIYRSGVARYLEFGISRLSRSSLPPNGSDVAMVASRIAERKEFL